MADVNELHRVTVNLIPKAWDAVEKTAAREGLNKTDVINRAVQVYGFVSEVVAANGELYVREAGSESLKLIKLF